MCFETVISSKVSGGWKNEHADILKVEAADLHTSHPRALKHPSQWRNTSKEGSKAFCIQAPDYCYGAFIFKVYIVSIELTWILSYISSYRSTKIVFAWKHCFYLSVSVSAVPKLHIISKKDLVWYVQKLPRHFLLCNVFDSDNNNSACMETLFIWRKKVIVRSKFWAAQIFWECIIQT